MKVPKKILIVDDEKSITKILRKRLESHGFDVEECHDGRSALDLIRENKYNLVILDYHMPELKGDELLKIVRSEKSLRKLPILVMTAYRSRNEDYFRDLGATDVIYKPADDDYLIDTIKNSLN